MNEVKGEKVGEEERTEGSEEELMWGCGGGGGLLHAPLMSSASPSYHTQTLTHTKKNSLGGQSILDRRLSILDNIQMQGLKYSPPHSLLAQQQKYLGRPKKKWCTEDNAIIIQIMS